MSELVMPQIESGFTVPQVQTEKSPARREDWVSHAQRVIPQDVRNKLKVNVVLTLPANDARKGILLVLNGKEYGVQPHEETLLPLDVVGIIAKTSYSQTRREVTVSEDGRTVIKPKTRIMQEYPYQIVPDAYMNKVNEFVMYYEKKAKEEAENPVAVAKVADPVVKEDKPAKAKPVKKAKSKAKKVKNDDSEIKSPDHLQ